MGIALNNDLLTRITSQLDLILAIGVMLIICIISYKILRYFF